MKRAIFFVLTLCLAIVAEARNDGRLSKSEAAEAVEKARNEWMKATRERLRDVGTTHAVGNDSLRMRFAEQTFGKMPHDGYSLFISLHGGGNTATEVNDGQWRNQMRLYTPQASVYVAPRAPWDDWDMWFKPSIDPLYEELIAWAVAFRGVNPDKVYLMGYSAGGDGVWRLAPRMADHWAAAAMMAGHPGDVGLVNVRNCPFTIWCGAEDHAYQRAERLEERADELDSLKSDDPNGYTHEAHLMAGKGHWMDRADTVAVRWMQQFKRNPYPKKIVWRQEEVAKHCFYWIEVPADEATHGRTVEVEVRGNTIEIARCDYSRLTLWLNDDIVDLDSKVTVVHGGRRLFRGRVPRTAANIRASLFSRNDPSYAFPSKLTVAL